MNRSFPPRAAIAAAPRRAGAFSLVITLIIVSMLAVVVIGYLSSMSSERVTADAFGNKTRAEQAAQAGVDSAMAILRQAFKDFPDSATAWENHSRNGDADPSGAFDGSHPVAPYNEGTSLYVRAMPDTNTGLPDPTADNSPNHAVPSPAPNAGSDARTTFVLPLISGANYKPISERAATVSSTIYQKGSIRDQDNFVDLNVLRYKGDTQGWIGSPPVPSASATPTPAPGATPASAAPPKTTRVPWVEIKQADAKDPANAPVVARYAFWVEDESFRANVNYAGVGDGTTDVTTRRLDNNAAFPIVAPTPGGVPGPNQALNASNVDLYTPLRLLNDSSALTHANGILKLRGLYPGSLFSESLGYSHAGDGPEFSAPERLDATFADQLRFLTTTTSAGLNLSRHGSQRFSLNNLLYPGGVAAPSSREETQKRIDTIIKTIQFHAPNFGQRFYRLVNGWPGNAYDSITLNALTVDGDHSDPTGPLRDHKLIYLNRIAANIHDYMDEDDKPTFIDQTGNVVTGIFQGLQGFDRVNNASPIWANGKEAIPYMEECAARFRLQAESPINNLPRYHLIVDYYVEYWNMTGRDIQLGEGAKIRVSQPPPWTGNSTATGTSGTDTWLDCDSDDHISPSQSREWTDGAPNRPTTPARDFDIDISNVVFKAGRCTVITTDPQWKEVITNWQLFNNDPTSATENPPNVYVCLFDKPGKRDYVGYIPVLRSTATNPPTYCKYIHVPPGAQYSNTASSDYKTSIVTYNKKDAFYYDLLEGALPMANTTAFSMQLLPTIGTTAYKLYGGSLRGNTGASGSFPAISGDPRTNNEQMDYVLYLSGGPADQSRYFNFTYSSNGGSGSDSSLGYPNVNFVKPNENTASGATPWPDGITFDSSLKKGVFSPAVIANSRLTSIGQLGDVFDPARWVKASDSTSLNAARGGGRTLKIGQHDDRWDGDSKSASRSWAAWRLIDFFCTDNALLQPGLINVNGIPRDNGAALRAALSGFKFQKNMPNGRGSPNLEGANALNVDPQPSPTPSGTPTPSLDALITQVKKRLAQPPGIGVPGYEPLNTGTGPFFERGEFSELPAFGRNNITTAAPTGYKASDLSGVDMGGLNEPAQKSLEVEDRGREELFRRLAEMITTRGDVFTVYAMGQSITQLAQKDSSGNFPKRVTGTQRIKITFRLVPKTIYTPTTTATAATASDFHPATDASGAAVPFDFAKRFLKPDHYDIQILSSSKGGG